MEGIWTYEISKRQAGGVIIAKNNKLYGGDSGYFFSGTYTIEGASVEGNLDASLFNPAGIQASVWGDKAQKFQLIFRGNVVDNIINGQIQRIGITQQFPVKLVRRADVP